ncbi:hypothetical protein F7734_52830 [Scytonema sp. UIC 10036]|uniref:hypothetical protein n=1 Tax=Scytonema sp. UIC 10036 TaxID=2304196 RepID=UPI0012DAAB60|nr:hypothetical protein [Scytonema sp. UIC 10036]MUH00501.1 hypothetical protein [Scytonema sp. UIC 10036]
MTSNNSEPTNTSCDRIKPPKQVSAPAYIDIDDLEAMREKRRDRIQEIKSRNWA